MRQEYQVPSTKVINIEYISSILANSTGVNIIDRSADKDEEVLSRRGSFWDDDEQ